MIGASFYTKNIYKLNYIIIINVDKLKLPKIGIKIIVIENRASK